MRHFELLGGPSRGERQDAEHGKSEPDQDRRKRDQECGSFHGRLLLCRSPALAQLGCPNPDETLPSMGALAQITSRLHCPLPGQLATCRSDGSLLPPTSWPRRPLSPERRA